VCEWEETALAQLRAAILMDPVEEARYCNIYTRIKIAYEAYLSMSFDELSKQTELSSVEKAIILFNRYTNSYNSLEQVEQCQDHILSLFSPGLSRDDAKQIFAILARTYEIYMTKLNQRKLLATQQKRAKFAEAKDKVSKNQYVKEYIDYEIVEYFKSWPLNLFA
jgi:hypothetical protein